MSKVEKHLLSKGFEGLMLTGEDDKCFYYTDDVLYDVIIKKQTNSIIYREKGFDEWNAAE